MKFESLKSSKFEAFKDSVIGQLATHCIIGSKLLQTTYHMGGVSGKDTNNTETSAGTWHDSSGKIYDIEIHKSVIPLGGSTFANQFCQQQGGVRLTSEKELALQSGIQQMTAIMSEIASFQ